MEQYKPAQGSFARLSATMGLILAAFLGSRELYSWIQTKADTALLDGAAFRHLPLLGVPFSWKFLLCVAVFLGLVWLIRRVMTRKTTVDTLIETEMELKKVSWPTKDESINATWVVIFVTVLITFVLFAFDAVLQSAFKLIF